MVEHVVALDVSALVPDYEEYLVIVAQVYQTGVEYDYRVLRAYGAGVYVVSPLQIQVRQLGEVEYLAGVFEVLVYFRVALACHLQVAAGVLHGVDLFHHVLGDELAGSLQPWSLLERKQRLLVKRVFV